MIQLKNNSTILDIKEYNNDFPIVTFNLDNHYLQNNNALFIDFKNDKDYSIKCLKKLIKLENNNTMFNSDYNGLHIKYIISNYNEEVLNSLQAINISDVKSKYTFIYDYIFSCLDSIWKKENPCNFCNNLCEATRNKKYIQQDDGCCYSFEYTNDLLSPSFITNKRKCKYLGNDKRCTTQNLSCKFFTCSYLKKYKNFYLNMNDFLIIKCFFNKKQQLILKYNFFHSKEEIINKLIEKNSTPLLLYYYKSLYRLK